MADLRVVVHNDTSEARVLGVGNTMRTILLLPGAEVTFSFDQTRDLHLWPLAAEIVGDMPNG